MLSNIFRGEKVSLIEMLDAREYRYHMQAKLLNLHKESSLLVVTMNIPGDIKNSDRIKEVFDSSVHAIEHSLKEEIIVFKEFTSDKTGNTAYFVVTMNPIKLKNIMLQIEKKHPQGRLFDLDVLYKEEDDILKVSRSEMNLEARTCFICQKDAKECGRSRAHSNDEMKEAIAIMIGETKE